VFAAFGPELGDFCWFVPDFGESLHQLQILHGDFPLLGRKDDGVLGTVAPAPLGRLPFGPAPADGPQFGLVDLLLPVLGEELGQPLSHE
jgi:hypothetical protein